MSGARWVASAIAVGVLFVGCSAPGSGEPTSAPSSTARPRPSPSPSASASSSPSPSPSATSTPSPSATIVLPPGVDPDATDGPVSPAPLPSQSADIGDPIEFGTGIDLSIPRVRAIEVTAETPGEVSGQAVAVDITAANGATEPQNLDSAVVSLVADDGTVGIGTTAGAPEPFTGTVAPGDSAEARYVFMLNDAAGRSVVITINYAAGEPVAVFTGKVS